jgi:hypothetical protein
MKLAGCANKASGLLAHEWAFQFFFLITAVRLMAVAHATGWLAVFFLLLSLIPLGLFFWWRQNQTDFRWRWRLLAYVPLMGAAYRGVEEAARWLPLADATWLQKCDHYLIGGNASVALQAYSFPLATDLFSLLYMGFFVYLAWALWDYRRGELAVFQCLMTGLFTIYAVGLFGYTLVSAGGPYLEMATAFTVPLEGGWLTRTCLTLVHRFSNRTDCFPCLHFAVSAFLLWFDWRTRSRRFCWLLLPGVGIWISTIYLRQHYLVDLFGGLVLAGFALWLVKPGLASADGIGKSDGL